MVESEIARWRRLLGGGVMPILAAAAIILAAALPSLVSPYELRLLTVGGIYALLVLGYQFVFGHAGALSLAQGTFFGLGAYVTGVLGGSYGWGFLATFPLSTLLPVVLAAAVGAPVLRLQSHYFALATLGIAEVASLVAVNWQEVTGGANGLPGVPGITALGGTLPRGVPLLALVWAAVLLAALFARRLARSGWGEAFRVLRASPLEAAAIGLDGGAMRFGAFLLGALYAGAAGAFYAHAIGVVSPEVMGFPVMVSCLTMAMVGGRTSILGAVAAAVLLVHLPEWLRVLGGAHFLAYGAALLAVILFAPEGLAGLVRWRRRRQLLPPVPAVGNDQEPTPIAAPRSPARLEIAGLAKRFGGVAALAGVDLALASGEILGLIGPNGSGKTTLVNLVSGLERPDGGTIVLDGAAIAGLPPHLIARRGIARSFQTSSLASENSGAEMSALEAVAVAALSGSGEVGLGCAVRGNAASRAAARRAALALLGRLGVGAWAMHACGALPHGVRRRVELARALALRPRLLLLDEPAAGLAAEERSALGETLAALARAGIGLLVIEHDMRFLLPLAHRLVCLDRGQVIAEGPPDAVRRDPKVLATYLGAAAADDGVIQDTIRGE